VLAGSIRSVRAHFVDQTFSPAHRTQLMIIVAAIDATADGHSELCSDSVLGTGRCPPARPVWRQLPPPSSASQSDFEIRPERCRSPSGSHHIGHCGDGCCVEPPSRGNVATHAGGPHRGSVTVYATVLVPLYATSLLKMFRLRQQQSEILNTEHGTQIVELRCKSRVRCAGLKEPHGKITNKRMLCRMFSWCETASPSLRRINAIPYHCSSRTEIFDIKFDCLSFKFLSSKTTGTPNVFCALRYSTNMSSELDMLDTQHTTTAISPSMVSPSTVLPTQAVSSIVSAAHRRQFSVCTLISIMSLKLQQQPEFRAAYRVPICDGGRFSDVMLSRLLGTRIQATPARIL